MAKPTQSLTDNQIARRRDDTLRRALGTPPKPHDEMKLGKKKRKAKHSASVVKR
jgi:hypothetical protein